MSRRGSVGRRCATCASGVTEAGRDKWVCKKDRGHKVTWIYRLDLNEEGEARRQETRTGFATRKLAETALAARLVEVEKGENLIPVKATVAEFLTDWLGSLGVQQKEAATVAWYQSAVERHINPSSIGSVKLTKLTPTMIERFLADKAANGRLDGGGPLGSASLRRLRVTLHKGLDSAVRKRLIPVNPVDLADRIEVEKKDVTETVWTPEQVTTFLTSTREDRLFPIWHLAAWTGLRRSELAGLQWPDIDLDTGMVTVRRARVVVTGTKDAIVKGPKSASSRRTVELDAGTVTVLRRWKAAQGRERMKVGSGWAVGEWVFTNQIGEPLRPDGILRMFQRRVKALGLPKTDIKGLRHAHATMMLKAGVNPKIVQERLGHKHISITMDTYSSVLPGMQKEAVEKLSQMMGGGS